MFDTTIPVGFGSGNQSTGAAVGSGSAVQRKRAAPGGSVSTTAPVSGTFYAHGGSADSSTSLASLGQIGSQSTNGNSSITTTSVTTGNNGDLAGSLGSAASSASAVLVIFQSFRSSFLYVSMPVFFRIHLWYLFEGLQTALQIKVAPDVRRTI